MQSGDGMKNDEPRTLEARVASCAIAASKLERLESAVSACRGEPQDHRGSVEASRAGGSHTPAYTPFIEVIDHGIVKKANGLRGSAR